MYLVLFLCIPLAAALLLIKLTEKSKNKKYGEFRQAVEAGAVRAVPITADFEKVMAQGAKDAVSTVKGYERIMTGYSSLPNFIVCYKEDEMYIMAVPCPSRQSMEVDPDFILHISADMLKEVKFGAMGKIVFYFKDSSQFFTMTVTDYAIPLVMQPGERKRFWGYMKGFAGRVN